MATQDQQNNVQQSNSPLNVQTFKIHGMKHDLSESAFENNFAFENMNMRINIVDSDNTLLNLTNERGTKSLNLTLLGKPIGCKKYANDKILLITTQDGSSSTKDHIYNITINSSDVISANDLTSGKNYGFSSNYPIEIEHYKDSEKDYFYLADGLNNFKTFWIENNTLKPNVNNIDYNKEISGTDSILYRIVKAQNAEFYSGVIVYCFCYVTEQGHKTGIIDMTPVIKLTNYGLSNGLEPNKKTNVAINIKCLKLSSNFKNVEIYSLYRSSLDGDMIVRKVTSINIKNSSIKAKTIIDDFNGERILTPTEIQNYYSDANYSIQNRNIDFVDENKGDIISYQELLTRVNSVLIPSTLCSKNNTLFLGNIKTNNFTALKSLISISGGKTVTNKDSYNSNYFYSKNKYYAGVQLQDKYGNWTPVIGVSQITYNQNVVLSSTFVNAAINQGYIAARGMMLDDKRVRNSIAQGIGLKTIKIEDGKYGVDIYAAYSHTLDNAIFEGFDAANIPNLTPAEDTPYYPPYLDAKGYSIGYTSFYDLYSPDVEFDENFYLDSSVTHKIEYASCAPTEYDPEIDVTLSSNNGVLFNNSDEIGKAIYDTNLNKFYWIDCIANYQNALQLQFGGDSLDQTNISLTPLFFLDTYDLYEEPTKFKIYVWQPSGSLNDSDGRVSVLNTKKIGWYSVWNAGASGSGTYSNTLNKQIYTFDGTNSIIPLNYNTALRSETKTYCGIVNQKLFQKTWTVGTVTNDDNSSSYFDSYNEQTIFYDFVRSFMRSTSFVGQPIEFQYPPRGTGQADYAYYKFLINYTVHQKILDDDITVNTNAIVYRWDGTSIDREPWSNIGGWHDKDFINNTGDGLPILVSNNFSRKNQITVTYRTNKHLIADIGGNSIKIKFLISDNENLNNVDIERGRWIVASPKDILTQNQALTLNMNLDDVYVWNYGGGYQSLISEPYSQYDTNQVCYLASVEGVSSYINPFCRCDKFINTRSPMNMSNEFFNKINMVYNQKNNFFIYTGITADTVTDDTLDNTILYSDLKVSNEKEDSFINLPTTNFFTIDSSINKINKLITYNDKILCFSDNAISQILYNENVVINTESVQSLGLASTDKVTGSQLITNTYGCLNKWSIGIFNNDLYFIDDLNNKLMVYNGEFLALNEKLGIETLNSKLIKNKVWNPTNWYNTKFNIDKYAKDVHYTTSDFDIAFNSELGSFTSLYSYENISFIETIGSHTIAFKYNSGNTNAVYLREGNYNQFFGTYKPFYTTVIVNQNSIVNKTLSYIEYSSEAYSMSNNTLVPQHNYTFSHIEFWNDYQESKDSHKVKIDYKMYGQSLLKRKFRIWRINRFRDYTRLPGRNYDMLSNTWHYMKLLTDGTALEQNYKLTFHWLNVYYR